MFFYLLNTFFHYWKAPQDSTSWFMERLRDGSEWFGLERSGDEFIFFLGILASVGLGILPVVRWILHRYRNSKIMRRQLIENDSQEKNYGVEHFIQTRYDRIPPIYEELDYLQKNNAVNKDRLYNLYLIRKIIERFAYKLSVGEKKLIPVLKRLIRNKEGQFYIVLGTAGMGKTTLLKKLFLDYTSPKRIGLQKSILYVRCNSKTDLERMKNASEKKDTILLLDALDEYRKLYDPKQEGDSDDVHFRKAVASLLQEANNFCKVIITCRTQYIPKEEQKYDRIELFCIDERGLSQSYIMYKYYIFPFNDSEIRSFLDKKYGIVQFWKWQKKKNALKAVMGNSKIMMRPLFLSYIDDLIEGEIPKNSFEVYDKLLQKWAEREAIKSPFPTNKEERITLKNTLSRFIQKFAIEFYNTKDNNGLEIENGKIYDTLNASQMKGKCLLVESVSKTWTFAHKSIYEFLLAKEAKENPVFLEQLWENRFAGLDVTKTFLKELGLLFPGMIEVQGGKFKHGTYKGEEVKDFWIGKFPVTQKEFAAFNPSHKSYFEGDNLPVENVSWFMATQFCNFMNDKYEFDYKYDERGNLSGTEGFRLPTEKEWEFAARGGIHSNGLMYAGSNEIDKVGWYWQNSGDKPLNGEWDSNKIIKNNGRTHPVGAKDPNELGIYDMSGNVWEWCEDWYDSKKEGKVVRGGSWYYYGHVCTVASRGHWNPQFGDSNVGFRLALQFK